MHLQRMGGFKRVAAALELAHLRARTGRSAAGAWSPDTATSSLTLVQFPSAARTAEQAPGSNSARTQPATGEPAVLLRPAAVLARSLSEGEARVLAQEQQALASEPSAVEESTAHAAMNGAAQAAPAAERTAVQAVGRRSSSRVNLLAPDGRPPVRTAAQDLPFSLARPPATVGRRGAAPGWGEQASCLLFPILRAHSWGTLHAGVMQHRY